MKVTLRLKLCNKNQLDAQFILSLFRQSTSTCFGHIYSSSSGGILYTYNNLYMLCFSVDCLLAGLPAKTCRGGKINALKKVKKVRQVG
jgi:hypothetical protein